jgi:hypothetical protein
VPVPYRAPRCPNRVAPQGYLCPAAALLRFDYSAVVTDPDISPGARVAATPPESASDPIRDNPAPLVPLGPLDAVTAEIETHLAMAGWDQAPALFALVPTRLVASEPEGARLLGVGPDDEIPVESLTPIAQDDLPDQPLDEALGGIEWPETVAGCAVSQEILILPPGAEDELSETEAIADAAAHPDRREARLVVAVTRDGRTSSVLRIRSQSPAQPDDIAFAGDLAPNLALALRATLE